MLRTRVGYRAIRAFLWVLTVLGIVLLVLQLVQAIEAGFTVGSIRQFVHAVLIPILPLLVLPSLANLWGLPAAHRYQAYLEAAWRGDDAQLPLADHQPEPDAATLALPITIRLRPRWQGLVSRNVLFILIASLYAVAYGLTQTPPIQLRLLAVSMFVFVASIFFGFVVALFVQRAEVNGSWVTVSDEGLSQHVAGISSDLYAIKWSEARVFAIAYGRKKRPGQVVYTLAAASPRQRVSWPRLCPPPRWYTTREPTVPFAEYNQQMLALLSLIEARTGLPLRDLR